MEVVLIKPVASLGNVGDTKIVKDGYAKNYLFPRKLAVMTHHPKAIIIQKDLEARAINRAITKNTTNHQLKKLDRQTVEFITSSAPNGTLFRAISAQDVAQALNIDKRYVKLEPIKKIGNYETIITVNRLRANVLIKIRPK